MIKMRAKLDNLNNCAVPFFRSPPPTCAGVMVKLKKIVQSNIKIDIMLLSKTIIN